MKAKMQEEKQPVVEQAVKKVGGGVGNQGPAAGSGKKKGNAYRNAEWKTNFLYMFLFTLGVGKKREETTEKFSIPIGIPQKAFNGCKTAASVPPPTHTSAHRVCAPVCVNFERNVNKQSAKDKNNNNQGIDLKRTLVKELTKNENKV